MKYNIHNDVPSPKFLSIDWSSIDPDSWIELPNEPLQSDAISYLKAQAAKHCLTIYPFIMGNSTWIYVVGTGKETIAAIDEAIISAVNKNGRIPMFMLAFEGGHLNIKKPLLRARINALVANGDILMEKDGSGRGRPRIVLVSTNIDPIADNTDEQAEQATKLDDYDF